MVVENLQQFLEPCCPQATVPAISMFDAGTQR
jgi:hypothetical protein